MIPFDFRDPEFLRNPYPTYHQLRDQTPVLEWQPRKWLISSWSAVASALRHPDVLVSPPAASGALRETTGVADQYESQSPHPLQHAFRRLSRIESRWFAILNPPDHTRLRNLVMDPLTSQSVSALAPLLQQICHDVVRQFEPNQQTDLIPNFAQQIPWRVLCHLMDLTDLSFEHFRQWSSDLADGLNPDAGTTTRKRFQFSLLNFVNYFEKLIEHRRQAPGSDLISQLVTAQRNGLLNDIELFSTCVFMPFASWKSTSSMLGIAAHLLLTHPDQREALRTEPELWKPAVEEILRYDTTGQVLIRVATADLELDGHNIPEGSTLYLLIGAANRDPARFPDPDRFDITRTGSSHLSFGLDEHYCPGAHLARAELQAGLQTLLQSCPNLTLANSEPQWSASWRIRALQTLAVCTDDRSTKPGRSEL